MNRALRPVLLVLLGFLALNAMPVGALLVADPDGSAIGMTPAMLERGPFHDFRAPGVLLFALGAWHAVALVAVARTGPRAWILAALAGFGTCVWILVQVIMVTLSWLQPLIFCVGATELALALLWRRRLGS